MRFENFKIPMDGGERLLELMRDKTVGEAKLETHNTGFLYLWGEIEEKNIHLLAEIAKDFPKT